MRWEGASTRVAREVGEAGAIGQLGGGRSVWLEVVEWNGALLGASASSGRLRRDGGATGAE